MHELALFAGSGGGLLASRLLGWRTVCAVERDEYCQRVLLQRQRDGMLDKFPIWDDVRTFDGRPWRGIVDVVSGGYPCQAHSSASRGRRVAEDLWPEFRRIVADVAPRSVFAENVARRSIQGAAEDLRAMGYSVACMELSAAHLGADHVRKRYWLRAYADRDGELLEPVDAEVAGVPGVCPRVWEHFPGESGMADGVASRMERYRAIGNGWVPCVAVRAWRELSGQLIAAEGNRPVETRKGK